MNANRLMAAILCFTLLPVAPSASKWRPREGRELLGTVAPEWNGIRWIQGGPLTVAGLKGKVVLLRFWLIDCPYCERTAPALRELSSKYRDQGLVVVGLHHPKSEEARDLARVARAAKQLGFDFPIGQDDSWTTIRAYGVGSHFERFTSVSFLIDREGIIRVVHDGGEYHRGGGPEHRECNAAYEALDAAIRQALKTGVGGPLHSQGQLRPERGWAGTHGCVWGCGHALMSSQRRPRENSRAKTPTWKKQPGNLCSRTRLHGNELWLRSGRGQEGNDFADPVGGRTRRHLLRYR